MRILKIYQIFFLILSSNLLAQDTKLILLSKLSESSEQYGFYKLELRLASTFNETKPYVFKIYGIPNKDLILADGDKVYTGKIKPLEDKQFIIYLKPTQEGEGTIKYKIKLGNEHYSFISKYFVNLSQTFNSDKNMNVEKLALNIELPKVENKTSIETTKQDKKVKNNEELINTGMVKTQNRYSYIKLFLAGLSTIIILSLFYYKKKTRFFKETT